MESRSTLVPLAQVLGLSGAGILTGKQQLSPYLTLDQFC